MANKKFTEEEARERKNARQREYAKKIGYASQNRYHKERGHMVSFRLFSPQDDDIIAHLDKQSNKAGYFRELVRKDIEEKK